MLPIVALAMKLLPFAGMVPEVLKALGGDKAAEAAEKVVAVAKAVTGTGTGEDALQAIQENPDKALEYQKAMSAERLEFARIDMQDRDSARRREVEVKDKIPGTLAVAVTIGFFGILSYMLKFGAPQEGGEALLVMLGSLGTAWTAIIAYYFGSSLSSSKKDATIKSMAG